jgi:hypothetical protein
MEHLYLDAESRVGANNYEGRTGTRSDVVTGPLKNIKSLYMLLTKLGGLIEGYNKSECTDPRAKAGL